MVAPLGEVAGDALRVPLAAPLGDAHADAPVVPPLPLGAAVGAPPHAVSVASPSRTATLSAISFRCIGGSSVLYTYASYPNDRNIASVYHRWHGGERAKQHAVGTDTPYCCRRYGTDTVPMIGAQAGVCRS